MRPSRYAATMSAVASVEPSSTISSSNARIDCASTLSIAAPTYRSPLCTGISTVTSGVGGIALARLDPREVGTNPLERVVGPERILEPVPRCVERQIETDGMHDVLEGRGGAPARDRVRLGLLEDAVVEGAARRCEVAAVAPVAAHARLRSFGIRDDF